MNLLAGATGFLGNEILNELGLLEDQTLVVTRRKMDTLPCLLYTSPSPRDEL